MKFHIISPPDINKDFNYQNFDRVTDIISVDFFQFRPKHKSISERISFVRNHYKEISKICKKKNIKMIINNDFEIAERFLFDGIHLGQKDRMCKDAKEKFGNEFIVGVSCSDSPRLYYEAENQKADYVAFGPVFKTFSKEKKNNKHKKCIVFNKKIKIAFYIDWWDKS